MSLNVLIVDDSAVMRAMILKTMRMAGLPLGEVYQAANGQEGLEALDAHWIDLVIADINMPVMNGEEMIKSLRQNPDTSQTPVVVVSTEGSQTRIERLNRMGVKFVHKPFTPEIIRDTVMEITGLEDSDVGLDSDDSGADSF
jgi:two-component system chemotaxis response regulator CheY